MEFVPIEAALPPPCFHLAAGS